MPDVAYDPVALLRPRRRIDGISAVLLPLGAGGDIDWPAFRAHVLRTADCGLTPAVNMDTGYVHLLDDGRRRRVLAETRDVLGGRPFVAGAFVDDRPGDGWNRDVTLRALDAVTEHVGTPIVFQSFGLTGLGPGVVDAYAEIGRHCDRFLAFELAPCFAPFGRIYPLDVYAGLLEVRACVGAKHSSLKRDLEWQRLALRDRLRPDFRVYTGNDLAIDMVMYGSDYLLGLSTFAPDLFARRDALWAAGHSAFYELNDLLQYLGCFAFRAPVPAYKHSAAMFLHLRGWATNDRTHPGSPTRPETDRAVLQDIAACLGVLGGTDG
jgi:dihydrodipicolinate synthase/N-acetylneuraminate lyase